MEGGGEGEAAADTSSFPSSLLSFPQRRRRYKRREERKECLWESKATSEAVEGKAAICKKGAEEEREKNFRFRQINEVKRKKRKGEIEVRVHPQ